MTIQPHGSQTQKGSWFVNDLLSYLEILNAFQTRALHFHFVHFAFTANYVAQL